MNESNQESPNQAQRRCNKKPTEKRVNHKARFVKESFGDRHPIMAGSSFIKTWTFRNDGESEWPEDTIFAYTNGDDFKAQTYKVDGPILPNQDIEISLFLQAPTVPGNYNSFFRFVTGGNNRFGQKVWCDILVQAIPIQSSLPINQEIIEDRSSLLNDESLIMEIPARQIIQETSSLEVENIEQTEAKKEEVLPEVKPAIELS
jgi:hypothetical protein